VLARLATAARDEPLRERRIALGQEALRIARRGGDPTTLAAAIECCWIAMEGPEEHLSGEGIAVGDELIALGEQIGDKEKVFAGYDHRLHALWALADRAAVDVSVEALGELADELRQPPHYWSVGTTRAAVALMEGRFGDAEQLIAGAFAIGQRAERWNAAVSHRLALFVIRRAQGRLAEIEELMRRSVHEFPSLPRFPSALTHLYAELGRERETRATLDTLLARDLAREHRDAEWLFTISMLASPCALLEDRDAAERLYSILLPFERLYAHAPVESVFGAVARPLGVLATTVGRYDAAERHFATAIEIEEAMRAPPWRAHAQHDLATMLLARGDSGDTTRARRLLDEARTTYSELGMDAWAATARASADP
jgi:tetratricopeptide (TPR) repeat protein